jgi:hypothetical protein
MLQMPPAAKTPKKTVKMRKNAAFCAKHRHGGADGGGHT